MLINYLKEIPLFTHLKDAQLTEIASRCRKVLFKRGEVIFHKMDMSTDLYIVDSGTLKAVLSDEDEDDLFPEDHRRTALYEGYVELPPWDGVRATRLETLMDASDDELEPCRAGRAETWTLPTLITVSTAAQARTIASAISVVVAVPPRSAVRTRPSLRTCSMAWRMRAAATFSPAPSSRSTAGNKSGSGLARLTPTRSRPAP